MQTELNLEEEIVLKRIHFIRGSKIILDKDLAKLYQVETKQLKRHVKRNSERFLEDFSFELRQDEWENLRCQFGTSSWGGTRIAAMAFTEQGIAMLSSVLSSPIAIQSNIQIVRVITQMRKLAFTKLNPKSC
jgi:hypothetical protein